MLVYICSTAIYPRDIITESGSTPGKEYTTVTPTLFNDGVCDCPGFYFRGRCTHIEDSVQSCIFWDDPDRWPNGLETCPYCGEAVELYETSAIDYVGS